MSAQGLRGVVPVLVTPFLDSEAIDDEALLAQVDFLIGAGASAIAFGFGSEMQRLTEREADKILAAAAGRANGRARVIAHVVAGSVAGAVERVRVAVGLGASMAMLPPPFPIALSESEIFAFYAGVAEATEVPLIVQDAPAVTGVDLPVVLLARLALEIDTVSVLKIESIPSPDKINKVAGLIGGSATTILGGNGGADFYQELRRGVDGTMPGPAFAEVFTAIHNLYRDGLDREAKETFQRYLPLLCASGRCGDGFLFIQKEVLRRRGVIRCSALRKPALVPSAAFLEELDQFLDDLNVPMSSEALSSSTATAL